MAKIQVKIGRVVSNKMQKTVVIEVNERKPHPLYKKLVRKTRRFMAHTENKLTIGTIVKIGQTRPLSAKKRWQVLEVINHGATSDNA